VILNDWKIVPDAVDLTGWTALEKLDLSNTQLRRWPVLPLSLSHLIVSDNTLLNTGPQDADLVELPRLETFACHSTFISGADVTKITAAAIQAGRLKRLALGGRETSALPTPASADFPASDGLEELSVAAMLLDDSRLVQVRECVRAGITHLRLSECQDVSTDAVEWARAQGVQVEFLFPSRAAIPGRLQRYGDSGFARGF
jgi:F-box/TPR repeat protein Pof3